MNKLKLALIGCGRIADNHLRAVLANYRDIEVVALCDVIKNKALMEKLGYRIEVNEKDIPVNLGEIIHPEKINMYSDYKIMLRQEDIDICAIATESGYHAEIALYCLNHNRSMS